MYVPSGGPAGRFVAAPGSLSPLRLIAYQGSLSLCEIATGLLVGPTDRRLAVAGLYVTYVSGVNYYPEAARDADLSPGAPLRMVPEPENPHDAFAIAVHDARAIGRVGYVNAQKARVWSKVLASGEQLKAISLRGKGQGIGCQSVTILAARPEVVAHLLSSRTA